VLKVINLSKVEFWEIVLGKVQVPNDLVLHCNVFRSILRYILF